MVSKSDRQALERLYLVVALAFLFATAHGMAVQLKGLKTQVAPHWERGLSYLKIGIRWLKGVLHKGRDLFSPAPLFSQDTISTSLSSRAAPQAHEL